MTKSIDNAFEKLLNYLIKLSSRKENKMAKVTKKKVAAKKPASKSKAKAKAMPAKKMAKKMCK